MYPLTQPMTKKCSPATVTARPMTSTIMIPVITFIKGDAKSGDTLVSPFGGKNCIARVPRMCLCGKADLDNPLHRCLWIRMRRAWEKEMKEYMATLDAMSAHHCDNASSI